jgi:hypothetical protein
MAESVSNVESLFILDNGFHEVLCDSQGKTASVALLARTLSNIFCSTAKLLSDMRDFLRCDNWYPLYENMVYDAMCFAGTDAFAWAAITQFVIVLMAMVILTFRIAFYEIEISEDEEDKVNDKDSDNVRREEDAKSTTSSNARMEQPQSNNHNDNDEDDNGNQVGGDPIVDIMDMAGKFENY